MTDLTAEAEPPKAERAQTELSRVEPRPAPLFTPVDSGLAGLAVIAGYYRIAADPAQLRHQLALTGRFAAAEDIVRGANDLELRSRILRGVTAKRLAAVPYPALIGLKNGAFGVLAASPTKGLARLKEATRQRLDMSIAYQNKLIETLTQLVSTRQEALDREVGSKVNLYDSTQQLEKSQSSLASDEGELIETDAALKELGSEKIMTLSQFIADNENKLADAERKVDEAKQAVVKAGARLARTELHSPADGIAQQIAVTTVGQVVTTGQQLLVVAPTQGALQVEALVANLDIGFVKPGQSAVIKVDAFPFTRFGVLHGTVTRIASEAVEEQEAKRGLANAAASANTTNAAPTSQAGQPQSFVFPVTIAIEEQAMNINGGMVPLTSGMTVTVEIKTDRRRVIDYLLSPLAMCDR